MNLLIDPATGSPRWDAAEQKLAPKESFAFEAARRLQAGSMSLEELKKQIIAAANHEWHKRGNKGLLETLNDVKARIGKSGKDWFFEIQRVCEKPELLQKLIDQKGRGLTALSRVAGPVQAQRRKGYSDKGSTAIMKDLIDVLEQARRRIAAREIPGELFLSACAEDLARYRKLFGEAVERD